MSKEGNKSKAIYGITAIICIVVAVILLVAWLLNSRSETRYSSDKAEENTSSLDCTISSLTEDISNVFDYGTPETTSCQIKMIFKNDKLDVLTFGYNGTYSSEKLAEDEMSRMHADYNGYMSGHNLSQSLLNPTFTRDKETVKITLYSEKGKIDNITAPFFFITSDEFALSKDYSEKTMNKIYENKGFSCKSHD